MKTIDVSRWCRLWLAGCVVFSLAACDDEKAPDDGTGPPSTPVTIARIIVNPRAAAEGDTVLLTADVRSSSPNEGDVPDMLWTASDGSFLETDELTVRWVAPATSGLSEITARATNSVGSTTRKTSVFVGTEATVVTSEAGAIKLIGGGPDFYYQRSANVTLGTDVFKYVAGFGTDATPPTRANNFDLTYAPDLTFEVHYADTLPPVPASILPRVIHVGWLTQGTFQRVSVDSAIATSTKRHQFAAPAVSPNSHLIAFQGWLQSPEGAAIDSFHVFVYDVIQNQRSVVTGQQQFPRNFYPSFSTDQKWLVMLSDPAGIGQWDLYGAPVNGDVVDGTNSSFTRLTNTGGSMGAGSPAQVKKPRQKWNPSAPVLAVVAVDGTLYRVTTTTTGANAEDVAGLPGSVLDLVWSPDGSRLAVVVGGHEIGDDEFGGAIYAVDGTSPTLIYAVPRGDVVHDIAWSPNGNWMVCRIVRGAQSWFELVDVDGLTLATPVAITTSRPSGSLDAYRGVMSMSPAWGSGSILYLPVFGLAGGNVTPGIISQNIASALQ